MKVIITILLGLLCLSKVNAMFDENNALYAAIELHLGNYLGSDISLNYVYKEKYSFHIGHMDNFREAKSKPDDYRTGLAGILLFGLVEPFDKIDIYRIGIGEIFKLNQSGTVRFNLSIGLAYTIITEPVNWKKTGSVITSNYEWDYKKYRTISLTFNPKIEYAIARGFGLTLSPLFHVNSDGGAYYGIGTGIIFGLIR